MRRLVGVGGFAACALVSALASCRDATEVYVDVRTNVPWSSSIVTSFTVGAPGATESASEAAETRAPWGGDGFVGSLVVVPGASKDAALSVKIVMSLRGDASACTVEHPDGCIFARRELSYLPHRRLELPIVLYDTCVGVACGNGTTCNAEGACVGANVDPMTCDDPSGCAPEGDPPPDGGVSPDASFPEKPAEAGPIEAGHEASFPDSSLSDGGAVPACKAGMLFCGPGACSVNAQCCSAQGEPGQAMCEPFCKAGDVRYCCAATDCTGQLACKGAFIGGSAGTCQ
ncbi:MAG TPA: hypothetical protein VIF62_21895 [Labilithrix sp.]